MSIWKTPDQKPDKNEPIIIRNWAGVLYSVPCMPFPTMREDRTWAYLREVVAQADKAERLQKALCFIRNIRGAGMSYQDMFLDAHEVAKTALDPEYKPILCGRYDEEMLDLIKQLIKRG